MSRGRRYEQEPKLNMKKVFAVIIAIVVIIMFVFVIKTLLSKDKEQGKNIGTQYFAIFSNNKWGVVDSKGKTIIEPSYEDMILIPDSKKDVFICTYGTDYNAGTYQTKALNAKNEQIFKDYEKVEALQNQDKSNTVWYEENVLKVQKDNKTGLINLEGKELLPCEYDEITTLIGTKNSLLLKQGDKYGLADDKGSVVIPVEYEEIMAMGTDYQEGYIIKKDGKYGVIGFDKQSILEPKYEEVKPVTGNNMYVVKEDGTLKLIQKSGETVLDKGFNNITDIHEQNIVVENKGKYGILNTAGETKVEPTYEEIQYAFGTNYIVKRNGKYGIVNTEGETKVEPTYNSLSYNKEAGILLGSKDELDTDFINESFEVKLTGILAEMNTQKGYMKVRTDKKDTYYNFKFEEKTAKDIFTTNTLFVIEKDGKYGYEDKDGKVIVQPVYDEAQEQNNFGFAAVKKDGRWGCIDAKGTVVLEPKYNLDNNIVIDFIGTWHYGTDLNINYYTDK